jgi:uncharacterized protein (DUF58 family)
MLVYSASRFGVLLACLVVLYVLGARQLLLVGLALLLSMLLSYVLLRGQREALASSVLERREKLRQRMDDATTAEDAADDAARDDQP